jgi:AAA+ ATPase superfamily predicted ATPase
MGKRSSNPFSLGTYDGPDRFCDREEETRRILEAVDNGRNLLLISLRRMGKTGLLFHVLEKLKKRGDACFYLDLLSGSSAEDFTLALAREVIGKLEKPTEKWARQISTLFRNLVPVITFDNLSGQPSLELKLSKPSLAVQTLEEIMTFLGRQQKPIVLALDEFQQVAAYAEGSFEATLRSLSQKHGNIRFIFSGSEKHVLAQMFSYAKRPFYQSAEPMSLEPVPAEKYKAFITAHFKKAGRTIAPTALDFIFQWTWGHTYYVQYFCNRLFATGVMSVSEGDARLMALRILTEQESIFNTYKLIIPHAQWNLLTGIAKEQEGASKLFSGRFIKTYNIGSPGSVRNILKGLLDKQLVFEEQGRYYCYDRFLGRWLERL